MRTEETVDHIAGKIAINELKQRIADGDKFAKEKLGILYYKASQHSSHSIVQSAECFASLVESGDKEHALTLARICDAKAREEWLSRIHYFKTTRYTKHEDLIDVLFSVAYRVFDNTDFKNAVRYYKMAIQYYKETNRPDVDGALYDLGNLYMNAWGNSHDYVKAIKCWQECGGKYIELAKQRLDNCNIGGLSLSDEYLANWQKWHDGVASKNPSTNHLYEMAKHFIKMKSMSMGLISDNLSISAETNKNVSRFNIQVSECLYLILLMMSSHKGHSKSQYELGMLYSNNPRLRDLKKAHYWLNMAVTNGDEQAKMQLTTLNQ